MPSNPGRQSSNSSSTCLTWFADMTKPVSIELEAQRTRGRQTALAGGHPQKERTKETRTSGVIALKTQG